MASEALQFSYALVQRFANSLFGIPLLLLQRFNVMAVAETTGSTPPMYNDWPLSLLSTPTHKTGNNDPFTKEASHMVLSHNSLIRGYNSIYQQAPRLLSSDNKDFIGYCLAWHTCVAKHHQYEETLFFPAIEKATNVRGIMDGEVEQHAAFHNGLENFKTYLLQLSQRESEFSSDELISIMKSFSEPLYSHLQSEPEALLSISKYSTPENPIDLAQMALEAGKKGTTAGFVFNTLPVFLLNMETVEFEDGMWHNVFPPVSGAAKWIMTKGIPLWRRRQWRFVSCTPDGRRKRLAV